MPVTDLDTSAGETIAVVGCNGAIGSALVDGLLRSGKSVLGFDRDNSPRRSELTSYWHLDYANLQSGLETFGEVLRHHPDPLTGLAVMTGLYPAHRMCDESETSLAELFHANAIAPSCVVNAFISATVNGPRSIVVTSSLAARRSRIGTGAYSATKIALERLASTIALEHRDSGVRVNMVQPGYVASDSTINPVPEEYEASISESTGLVHPSDLVESFMWLLSPSSRMINGETISVDAGGHLGRKDEIAWLDDAN